MRNEQQPPVEIEPSEEAERLERIHFVLDSSYKVLDLAKLFPSIAETALLEKFKGPSEFEFPLRSGNGFNISISEGRIHFYVMRRSRNQLDLVGIPTNISHYKLILDVDQRGDDKPITDASFEYEDTERKGNRFVTVVTHRNNEIAKEEIKKVIEEITDEAHHDKSNDRKPPLLTYGRYVRLEYMKDQGYFYLDYKLTPQNILAEQKFVSKKFENIDPSDLT